MEEFLLKIGGFGRYQGFLMFFVFVTSFTCGSNYYSQVFSLLEPPKTCISDGLNTQGECLILSANNDTLECSNWSYNYSDQFPTLVSENNEVTNNIISEYFKENERTKESVKRRSLLDLTMFKRLFFNCSVITFVCCSCFMCYYGHVQNTANLGSSIYFNFIYGALVEIGAWIAPFIINRLGRRYIISSLLLLSGFSSISFGFTPDNSQLLKLCIALAGRIFITGAYFISLLYASEIFPTEIRGKGMAICEFIGGFGIIFSPSIIYLSKYGNSIPIMIFCVISIMAGLMSCCLPETANHKLAQTMEDGNIFGNNQRILPWIKNSSNKEVSVIV